MVALGWVVFYCRWHVRCPHLTVQTAERVTGSEGSRKHRFAWRAVERGHSGEVTGESWDDFFPWLEAGATCDVELRDSSGDFFVSSNPLWLRFQRKWIPMAGKEAREAGLAIVGLRICSALNPTSFSPYRATNERGTWRQGTDVLSCEITGAEARSGQSWREIVQSWVALLNLNRNRSALRPFNCQSKVVVVELEEAPHHPNTDCPFRSPISRLRSKDNQLQGPSDGVQAMEREVETSDN